MEICSGMMSHFHDLGVSSIVDTLEFSFLLSVSKDLAFVVIKTQTVSYFLEIHD